MTFKQVNWEYGVTVLKQTWQLWEQVKAKSYKLWLVLVSTTCYFIFVRKSWNFDIYYLVSVTKLNYPLSSISCLESWIQLMCNEVCPPWRVFFPGGTGGSPSGENFVNPPIRHLSPFLDQGLSPPHRGSSPKTWKI